MKLTYPELEGIADKIYTEVYGDVDDKRFRADKVAEIYDWLCDGEGIHDWVKVADLVAQWREYELDADSQRDEDEHLYTVGVGEGLKGYER